MIKFGYSKDKRRDFVQYRQILGTLDPSGMPLVSATLAGKKTDESDYLPTWREMKEIITATKFPLFKATLFHSQLSKTKGEQGVGSRGDF